MVLHIKAASSPPPPTVVNCFQICIFAWYCISVIQQVIRWLFKPPSHKIRELGKEVFPVIGGSTCFKIIGIVTAHLPSPYQHITILDMYKMLKVCRLVGNLCLDGLLP